MVFKRSQLPGQVQVPTETEQEREFMEWLLGQVYHRGEQGPEEFRDQPGPVEQEGILQSFLRGEWQVVTSSVHKAVRYDGVAHTLDVNFRGGGAITVHDFTEGEAVAYITAPSHGRYMWDHWLIRGKGNKGRTRKRITRR